MPARRDLKKVGSLGEATVVRYIEELGWKVLNRNYRCASGEIDIIAEEPDNGSCTLVFIEVKTRSGTRHGSALDALDDRKQKRLIAVAQTYLSTRDRTSDEPNCRFDVAEVSYIARGVPSVTIHRGAFTG